MRSVCVRWCLEADWTDVCAPQQVCVCGHTPIPEFRIGWNYSDFGWLRTGGQVLANATAAYMDKADIVMHIVNIYILRQYSGIAHCVEILSRELFIHWVAVISSSIGVYMYVILSRMWWLLWDLSSNVIAYKQIIHMIYGVVDRATQNMCIRFINKYNVNAINWLT